MGWEEGRPTPPPSRIYVCDIDPGLNTGQQWRPVTFPTRSQFFALFFPHRDITDSAQASIDSQRATARAGYALDLQSKEQRKAAARLQQQQLQQRAGGVRGGGEGAEGAEGGERGEGGGGGGASGLVAPSWVRCVHACMHAVVFFVGTLDAPEPGCCSSGARN